LVNNEDEDKKSKAGSIKCLVKLGAIFFGTQKGWNQVRTGQTGVVHVPKKVEPIQPVLNEFPK